MNDGPHTILMTHQLHISFVGMANHLHGSPNKGVCMVTMAAWTYASPPRGTKSPRCLALPFPSEPEINLERRTCGVMRLIR